MSADRGLRGALADLSAALHDSSADYMIIGGIAVIARGISRQTVDIDATVWAPALSVDELVKTLRLRGIESRIPDLIAFAGESQVLLLEHVSSGTPIEVSLGWLPFEREALDRAEVLSLGGSEVRVARAEDLVIYKAVAWRDRDRSDIERLLILHGDDIDLERVRSLVAEFAEALEDPDRLDGFDALVRCAQGPDSDSSQVT